MSLLQFLSTILSGPLSGGARITDLCTGPGSASGVLYAGTLPGASSLISFQLAAGQPAALIDSVGIVASVSPFGPTRVDFLPVPTGHAILPTGRFGAELGGFLLYSGGIFGPSRSYSDGAGQGGDLGDLEVLQFGGASWIYGTVPGGGGVLSWQVAAGTSTPVQMPTLADSAALLLGGADRLVSASVGNETWLFVVSAVEDGITSLRVNPNGSLTVMGQIGAVNGLGIADPVAVEVVTISGSTYVIVASTQSSSLSVLRADHSGLVPVDHVTDSLLTRFAAPVAVETITIGDRVFVLSGGTDDGLSVFQLLPDGRMILIETLTDTAGMALADIATIKACVVGSEIQVFVASGSENGLTQFSFDPGPAGSTQIGGAGSDTVAGGGLADVLMGGRGDDVLSGGGGDDIIVDGQGVDNLVGGAGSDLLVLLLDGTADRIIDFDPATDRLDLSDYPLLYGVGQITIQTIANGAILTYGAEQVVVYSASGGPLTAADFNDANVLNLPRSPVQQIVAGRIEPGTTGDDTITGTAFADRLMGDAGDDVIIGLAGNDTLEGGAGADTLNGGQGQDWVSYDDAQGPVAVDLVLQALNRGDAAGDAFSAIESVRGSDFADLIAGDAGNNELSGGLGNDSLDGRAGADTLDGGEGDDRLVGGGGADVLIGGTGRDIADFGASTAAIRVDLLAAVGRAGDAFGDLFSGIEDVRGGSGADLIVGSAGANLLIGGQGADALVGSAGNDTLTGDAGADRLDGGQGTDTAAYGSASGGLFIDLMGLAPNTGDAAGDTFVSVEIVVTGQFADTVRGALTADVLASGDGNDILDGRSGNDVLLGGAGGDILTGGIGRDRIDGGAGYDFASYRTAKAGVRVDLNAPAVNLGDALGDTLFGVEGLQGSNHADVLTSDLSDNFLYGLSGNDRIYSYDGNDTLVGGVGDDGLYGMNGNDFFRGGAGKDFIHGGAGVDMALYDDSPTALRVDLLVPSVNTGIAAGDQFVGIEGIRGGVGNDSLFGSTGNDRVEGSAGNDQLFGRAGNDTLRGGAGGDVMDGGAGLDVADYSDVASGVTADLQVPAANTSFASGDVFASIEGLSGGGGADRFLGNSAANLLTGGAGDDVLDGRTGDDSLLGQAGRDTLVGGAGNDLLAGGADADTFVFLAGSGADTVADLGAGDVLLLDPGLVVLAGTTVAAMISAQGTVVGADFLLDLGGGDTILLRNVTDPNLVVAATSLGLFP